MEQAVIYPGVYAKSLLLRGKNLTNVFVNDAVRHVRLPLAGQAVSRSVFFRVGR